MTVQSGDKKKRLDPRNLTAQLHYRAEGNPFNSLPSTAISNCFPGLEYDFRNLWRRSFVGIVLLENSNYVIDVEDQSYQGLKGHRLLRVEGQPLVTTVQGPQMPGAGSSPLGTASNPSAVAFLEWSNSLVRVLQRAGERVRCEFTPEVAPDDTPIPQDTSQLLTVELEVRRFFEGQSAALANNLLQPGELTQGLCSPWQNDYRECACYYWAASRPDYVNVEPSPSGASHGDNWLQKQRSGEYVLDDRKDSRLVTYDDLFTAWERELRFIIRGRDADES